MSILDDLPVPLDLPTGNVIRGTRNVMENQTPNINADPRSTSHDAGHLYGFMIVEVGSDGSISTPTDGTIAYGTEADREGYQVKDMTVPREGHDTEYFFTVPPQNIQFTEPATVQVQPTIDGYLVEHHGSLLKQLNISGPTGFRPMSVSRVLPRGGLATGFGLLAGETQNQAQRIVNAVQQLISLDERGIPADERTGYFNFMQLRSLFRHYFNLKSRAKSRVNDDTSSLDKQIRMLWVNYHELEFWFCEPLTFGTRREASSPLTFSYDISCYILGKPSDDTVAQFGIDWHTKLVDYQNVVGFVTGAVQRASNLFNQIGNLSDAITSDVVGMVNRVSSMGLSLTSTVGSVAGKFRDLDYLGERIDELQNDLTDIRTAWNNSISANPDLTSKYEEFESANTINDATRVLNRLNTSRRDIASSRNATTSQALYSSQAASQNTGDRPGQANPPKPGQRNFGDRLDPRNSESDLQGGRLDTVMLGEDIRSLAKRTLGTETRWKEIVIVNSLSAPYIASVAAPGVLVPGDRVLIPGTSAIGKISGNLVLPTQADEFGGSISGFSPENVVFGRDIAVSITGDATGSMQIDLKESPTGDAALVAGIENFKQALLLLSNTELGSLKLHPSYGFPRIVGMRARSFISGAFWSLGVKRALNAEPRVAQIADIGVGILGDTLIGKVDVIGQRSLIRVPLTTRNVG